LPLSRAVVTVFPQVHDPVPFVHQHVEAAALLVLLTFDVPSTSAFWRRGDSPWQFRDFPRYLRVRPFMSRMSQRPDILRASVTAINRPKPLLMRLSGLLFRYSSLLRFLLPRPER